MRNFFKVIVKASKRFETHDFKTRLKSSLRKVIFPASLLLLFCLFRFQWDIFLIALSIPLIILPLIYRYRKGFNAVETARILDSDHEFNDLLSTAYEFRERESDTPILKALMDDADRCASRVRLPEEDPNVSTESRIWAIILAMLMILIIALNMYPLFKSLAGGRTQSDEIRELESMIEKIPENTEIGRRLRAILNDLKNGKGLPDGKIGSEDLKAIEKAAEALEKDTMTKKLAKSCQQGCKNCGGGGSENGVNPQCGEGSRSGPENSDGDGGQNQNAFAEAAGACRQLGGSLAKSSSGKQNENDNLQNSLSGASSELNKRDLTAPLGKSFDEMSKNTNNPEEFRQASEKAAKELEKLGQTMQALSEITQKLKESIRNSMSEKNPDIPLKQPEGDKEKDAKCGNKSETTSFEKVMQDKRKQVSKLLKNENGNKGSSADKKSGSDQVNKETHEIPKPDPTEFFKNSKAFEIDQKNAFDYDSKVTNASRPQLMPDFQKQPELSDEVKIQLKANQDMMVKSREIDMFSQRHGIPKTLKTFLKGFYLHGPVKPTDVKKDVNRR